MRAIDAALDRIDLDALRDAQEPPGRAGRPADLTELLLGGAPVAAAEGGVVDGRRPPLRASAPAAPRIA